MNDLKPWLNGAPYYCKLCGAGYGEYLACEDVGCELETLEDAIARMRDALKSTPAREGD